MVTSLSEIIETSNILKFIANRTGLDFDADNNNEGNRHKSRVGLSDLVGDNKKELPDILFGKGFECITDIQTGPKNLLYVLIC
jgi:hypothetical protein